MSWRTFIWIFQNCWYLHTFLFWYLNFFSILTICQWKWCDHPNIWIFHLYFHPFIWNYFILKAKTQIISLYNAPHLCYILHEESSSGLTVLSMSKTMPFLSDQVVLKKLESRDKLGNDKESKWKIIKDERNEGWMFIQESTSGQYLTAHADKTRLETEGIWFLITLYLIFLFKVCSEFKETTFWDGHFMTISGHSITNYINIFHKTKVRMVILRCFIKFWVLTGKERENCIKHRVREVSQITLALFDIFWTWMYPCLHFYYIIQLLLVSISLTTYLQSCAK